jgi:hypothetical protein
VVPKHDKYAEYRRVEFLKGEGRKRFLELSHSLFGKELAGAQRYQKLSRLLRRPVPVPTIAINSRLVFETIPSTEEPKACIDRFMNKPILSDQKKKNS